MAKFVTHPSIQQQQHNEQHVGNESLSSLRSLSLISVVAVNFIRKRMNDWVSE